MANEGFSLLGGPLHRLGIRLGLVRNGTNTVRLGLALGLVPWAVLMLLVVLEGAGREALSLARVAAHVRMLVAIPLFFICEAWLDPQMGRFVRYLVDSGVVPAGTVPALQSAIRRTARLRDSWLVEAALVVLAIFSPWLARHLPFLGVTGGHETGDIESASVLAGRWYWLVCLPLFRFLMFRWAWRLVLWWRFLWKVSRLELDLVPTHPDGAAGLGYLEIVHAHFVPLVLAISAVMSASFAEDISTGRMTFTSLYTAVATLLAVDALLFLGPLLIFAPRLWRCRVKGMSDYMVLAARYVEGFDGKWVRGYRARDKELLGTPDLQSLADLANSVDIVRDMRWFLVSLRLAANLIVAALVPLLPLLLLKYPVTELFARLFSRLSGL